MLDFSILSGFGKVAIKCVTEMEAKYLLSEMWKQYPDFMNHWSHTDTKWYMYKEETCYAPHIFDNQAPNMQYCRSGYWIDEGYMIIPFEELMVNMFDYGEITSGEIRLEDLFK